MSKFHITRKSVKSDRKGTIFYWNSKELFTLLISDTINERLLNSNVIISTINNAHRGGRRQSQNVC